jgi:hypothetical protein
MSSAALSLVDRLGSWARFSINQRPTSVEKSADVVSLDVPRLLADPAFIGRCLDVAFPAGSQSEQCTMASRATGNSPETIRRWLHGLTRPSLKDFGPILFMVIQKRANKRTYRDLLEVMRDV